MIKAIRGVAAGAFGVATVCYWLWTMFSVFWSIYVFYVGGHFFIWDVQGGFTTGTLWMIFGATVYYYVCMFLWVGVAAIANAFGLLKAQA